MATITEMQNKLKRIDVWGLLLPIIEKSASEIVDLNREQLRDGELSTGQVTGKYSEKYLKWKQTRPTYHATPNADLYKTGKFQSKMYAKVNKNGIKIGSDDKEKEGKLEGVYSKNIFKLQPDNLNQKIGEWRVKLVKAIIAKI